MIRRALAILAVSCMLFSSGCAYTNIRNPLDSDIDNTDLGSKVGQASNYSLLWLVAWGDASYAQAAKNGNITVMKHADRQYKQYFFGMYMEQTTIVYGD